MKTWKPLTISLKGNSSLCYMEMSSDDRGLDEDEESGDEVVSRIVLPGSLNEHIPLRRDAVDIVSVTYEEDGLFSRNDRSEGKKVNCWFCDKNIFSSKLR